MTNTFYCSNIEDEGLLSPEESLHLQKVLRIKIGEKITLLDGKGAKGVGTVTGFKGKQAFYKIEYQTFQKQRSAMNIHLAIAPTKNIDRMEWLVEKAVEIGIDRISFIQTERSERKQIKIEKLNATALSAIKQSGNIWLPQIDDMVKLEQFISQNHSGLKLIASLQDEAFSFNKLSFNGLQKVLCMVGPEGDFSEEEYGLATRHDFRPISLGNNILRTETAGLLSTIILNLKNDF